MRTFVPRGSTSIVLLLALGSSACGSERATGLSDGQVGARDIGPPPRDGPSLDAEADAGVPDLGPTGMCESNGRQYPTGIVFGDGCNFCLCDCDESGCMTRCTGAACDVGVQSALYPRCLTHDDCRPHPDGGVARAVCLYDPGCNEPLGTCVLVDSICPRDLPAEPTDGGAPGFCGCDGVTYSGICPTVPYERPGACGQ